MLPRAPGELVFEFQLQETAEEARAQIHLRRDHEKYTADGRELLLMGAAFDQRPATANAGWSRLWAWTWGG